MAGFTKSEGTVRNILSATPHAAEIIEVMAEPFPIARRDYLYDLLGDLLRKKPRLPSSVSNIFTGECPTVSVRSNFVLCFHCLLQPLLDGICQKFQEPLSY